jgi:hypothetical protein
MHLALDIEDASVSLVEMAQLSKQSPIVDLLGRLHNLVIGRRVPLYVLEEPGREWFGGLVHGVPADCVQVENIFGVTQASHGAQGARDGGVEEFDVTRLVFLAIGGGDIEIGESSMVFFVPFGAFVLLLLGLLGVELSELTAELAHFGHGVVVLVGAAECSVAEADGDRSEGGQVESAWGVEYVEGALGRQGEEFFVEGLAAWGNRDGSDLSILKVGDDGDGRLWEGDGQGSGLGRFHRHVEGIVGHLVRGLVCWVKILRERMTFPRLPRPLLSFALVSSGFSR